MSSGTVLPGLCAASGPWTFVASIPSVPISTGVYTAQYNGGQYLAISAAGAGSGTALTMVATVDPKTCYWYASNYYDATSGKTFTALFPPQNLDPLSQTLTPFLYVADPGSANCSASLTLGSTTSDPPVMTNGIMFGADPDDPKKQGLYSPGCNQRYIPSSDGKTLVPTQDADKENLWQFTQVMFPTPTTGVLPKGLYYLQWNEQGGPGGSIYLTNAGLPSFNFTDTYNFNSLELNVGGNLAFGCISGGANVILQFNPQSIFYAQSQTGGTTMNANIVATTSQMYIDGGALSGFQLIPYCRKEGGVGGITSIIVPPIFTLISGSVAWQYQITSMTTTGLTSLPSGDYIIQYGSDKKWCLQPDGTLGQCSTQAIKWTYDNVQNQLKYQGTYLKAGDPSIATCQPFQPFTTTTDGSNLDTKRFMLTTTNKLFDTASGFCYSSSVELHNPPKINVYGTTVSPAMTGLIVVGGLVGVTLMILLIAKYLKKRRRL